MQNTLINFKLRTSVWAVASCIALSWLPLPALAAGLGKITVFSALGQPLRAEVELSATPDELKGMTSQLASRDAFRDAGLDYAAALGGIRFTIDKRANGQSVIKLSSDKPVVDPFMDMLLELNWATGRLVREYTFLLDPPEMAGKAAAVETPSGYRYTETSKTAAELAANLARSTTGSVRDNAPLRAPDEARQTGRGGDTHRVKQGDTLSKIASAMKPDGVSLEQMLVGLFRANSDAFDGNMNRLKAGKILSVPEKGDLEAVAPSEAKKVVLTHSADWNGYRRNLAAAAAQAAPSQEEGGKREAAGKVTAKVEDKAAPSIEPKDQLRVSKAEAAAAKRTEEDLIAREKALKEANDRVSGLEKNVEDLQKLVELKNQNFAVLQKQLAAKGALPVEPVKPAESTITPPPSIPVVPVETKPQPVTPVETPPAAALAPPPVAEKTLEKPEEIKPPELPVEAASETKIEIQTEAIKPVEPPPPVQEVIVQPPAEEPGFVEELIDNPMLLGGGGILTLLLAAFFLIKRRRQSQQKNGIPPLERNALSSKSSVEGKSTLAPQGGVSVSGASVPNSVFNSTGGQSIDTSFLPPPSDFSQAGPGTIDTDEVDPVAEADVYMAYGRDAQAEEILLEAKQKDPKRHAIHLKLLEIYAHRKNISQFETLATDFYGETGGVGAEWEKAAAMGLKLDPKSPLFGGAGHEVEPEAAMQAPLVASLNFAMGAAEQAKAMVEPSVVEPTIEPVAIIPRVILEKSEEVSVMLSPAEFETAPLDFDLDETPVLPPVRHPEPELEPLSMTTNGLDFSLPDTTPAVEPIAVTAEPKKPPKDSDLDFDLEFDVKMTESTVLGESMQSPAFDITSINLDLDDFTGEGASKFEETVGEPTFASDFGKFEMESKPLEATEKPKNEVAWDQPHLAEIEPFPEIEISSNEEVTTKLDLANAYEEMGDLEGVRELLQEVLKEGDAAQKEKAQAILARINQ
jgi:pilus assembly protein FimV